MLYQVLPCMLNQAAMSSGMLNQLWYALPGSDMLCHKQRVRLSDLAASQLDWSCVQRTKGGRGAVLQTQARGRGGDKGGGGFNYRKGVTGECDGRRPMQMGCWR